MQMISSRVGGIIGGRHRVDGLFHHGPFVIGRDDHGQAGQRTRGQGIGLIAGPEDGAQELEAQHHQGITGGQPRQPGTVGMTAQQLPIGAAGAPPVGHNQGQGQEQGHQQLDGEIGPQPGLVRFGRWSDNFRRGDRRPGGDRS